MSKTLLVSMIGRGKYEKTCYRFEDGTEIEKYLFGSALYNYLRSKGYDLDVLFVGTVNSGWGELIDLTEDIGNQELFDRIWNKTVEEEELKEWIEVLSKALGTNIHYILLTDPPKPEEISQKLFIKLLELLEKAKYPKIVLDITHGYRFIPYAVSLGVLLLKNLKDFELEIYYGFLDYTTQDGKKPVWRLNHLEELVRLSEALSTLENSGDFRQYYRLVSDNSKEAEQIYFRIEGNSQISPNKLKDLINAQINSEYAKPIHEEVKRKYLEPLMANRTEDRLRNRARFFFERGQYLKAVLLLHEALLLLVGRLKGMLGSSGLEYKEREEVKRYLDSLNLEEWYLLKFLRNSFAHGTEPKLGNVRDAEQTIREVIGNVREAWMNEQKFKEVMERSFEFYEKIKRGEINIGG